MTDVFASWQWMVPAPVIPRSSPTKDAEILARVAAKHGLSVEDLKGDSLKRRITLPRQEAMHALCAEGLWSTTRIGWLLGGRDHTTVIHGRDAHAKRMAEESA